MINGKTACVFCGSSIGASPIFEHDARVLGELLAKSGTKLVYGGGSLGLMGAVAKAAMQHAGHVTGVIPKFLCSLEKPDLPLSELIVTSDMHERKMNMWERADGFIVLPGGVGTFEELLEQLTWVQLGQHHKPIILLNTNGYWNLLEALFHHMRSNGFIRKELEITYHLASSPSHALNVFETHATKHRQQEGIA
ncbi:MAG: TIGR00730 family Rossman fold protein [Hyphomicrobiaceae bacterium]